MDTPVTTPLDTAPGNANPPRALHAYPLRFSGSGSEYFRIWITNLLLIIVTFGIYSAWAKVRREQYFHRNTQLDQSGFDYHGQPWAILKGRVIALGLLILLNTVGDFAPEWYLLALVVLSPLLPWLILRSFIFRARNTSYRGLRFDFTGTYREAVSVILGWGLLTLLSLGLTFPIFVQRLKSFQLQHLRYGGESFQLRADIAGFYRAFLLVSLVVIVPVLLMATLILVGVVLASVGGQLATASGFFMVAAVGAFVLLYLATLLVVRPLLQVRLSNLVWNNTELGPHRFASSQRMATLFPIFLGNWILILLSLGLFWPWAQVRLAQYRADHTQVLADGKLDDFIGQASTQRQAVGEEIAEAFDLDIAL